MTDISKLKPGSALTYEQAMALPDCAVVSAIWGDDDLRTYCTVGSNNSLGVPKKFGGASLEYKKYWNDSQWHSVLLESLPEPAKDQPILPKNIITSVPTTMFYDIIYLDMDGVVVDFTKAVLQYFNWPLDTFIDNYEVERVIKISREEMLNCYNSSHDFWANMDKLPWADELFNWATENSNKVMFLSKPSEHPVSYSGKATWLKTHYPGTDFALVTSKSPNSKPGTLLVDDYYPNVVKFRRFGGHAAIFPRPWNCGLPDEGQDKIRLIKLDIEKYHGGLNGTT